MKLEKNIMGMGMHKIIEQMGKTNLEIERRLQLLKNG
jgi:hypothetical protein